MAIKKQDVCHLDPDVSGERSSKGLSVEKSDYLKISHPPQAEFEMTFSGRCVFAKVQ